MGIIQGAMIFGLVIYYVLPVIYANKPSWRDGQSWGTVDVVDTSDIDSYESAICNTLRCRRGEECVLQGRVGVCQCRQTCPHNDNPTCGSDGITYPSHCHLHRRACLSGRRLHIIKNGPCEAVTSELPPYANDTVNEEAGYGNRLQVKFPTWPEPSWTTPDSTDHDEVSSTLSIPKSMISISEKNLSICSKDDFLYVPNNLLLYFHAKYAETENGESLEKGKSYLVHLIYNRFDLNSDQAVTKDELQHFDDEGKYKKLMPTGCSLVDLLIHADTDGDGRLNEREFFRLFDLPVAFISPNNQIKIHQVEIGQQYQLFCDIEKYNRASLKVTWYRYDVPLVNVAPYDFEVSADGSLYLTPASLTHNGNFTCRVPISLNGASTAPISLELSSNELQQVHVVNVYERPRLTVTPDFLLLKTGENGFLQCNVDGYPMPKINWEKNGRLFRENVSILQLNNVRSYDTGSYRCVIASSPGMDQNANGGDFLYRTASVVVRDRYDQPEMALRFNSRHQPDSFCVFYEYGIRIFRADDCTLLHAIPSSYPVTENKEGFICHDKKCQWSDAVVTQSTAYLYAALPQQMALVKINMTSGIVEQFFHLNHVPMKLHYVEWEDTVWIECWHETNGNYRTVQVIRSASRPIQHTLTHALPLRDEFDAVHRIFLPKSGRLRYGYVTHVRERALHKIDLHSLKIVSRVSLEPYDCEPSGIAFIAQVSLAIVQCSPSVQPNNHTSIGGQLILDYISDATLAYDADTHGIPVATNDGRWIVNVDTTLGRIFVHKVDEKGGPLIATIDEFLPITDLAVHRSINSGSWDLYAVPLNSIHLVKITIPEAKVSRLSVFNDENKAKAITTVSTSNGGRYLAGATSESIFMMDLYDANDIKCSVNLNGTQKLIWTS